MNLYTTTFTQNQKPVTCYFSVVKGFFCFLYCKIQDFKVKIKNCNVIFKLVTLQNVICITVLPFYHCKSIAVFLIIYV